MRATYLEHFRLHERPFSNAPDSRFVYLGAEHERALAHLLRGARDEHGVVYLAGERGNGKTTMCRVFLHRLPRNVDVALILNPVFSPEDLLVAVCDELGVRYAMGASRQALEDALSRHLEAHAHARGRRTLLIVDDAQNLSRYAVDQLRRLASLPIDNEKRLRIILTGEPGLIELLGRLSPSIVAGHHLLPLAEPETCAYVRHRLGVAGGAHDLFDVEALRDVHHLSGGVPRLINDICDRALLGAAAQQRPGVDRLTVRAAARGATAPAGSDAPVEPASRVVPAPRIEPERHERQPVAVPVPARRPLWPWLVSGGLALNATVIGAVFLVPRQTNVSAPPPTAIVTAQAPPRVEASTVQPAPPRAEPATPSPPVTPPPAPALSVASAPYPSASERPRQQRREARATRGELWSTTSPPVSNFEPESPPQESSELKVDLLVWAVDPRERLVYLNGHKYVEGQKLENGALVEKIAEDSVVLVQEGRRIRLPAETARP